MPRRTDIDPRGIESLLENAFIAEKIAPGLARMRIAGTHLSDLMGMEVRGMPISAFIAPEQRDQLSNCWSKVFDRPAIVKINLESPAGVGRRALKGTLLLTAAAQRSGRYDRALWAVSDGWPDRAYTAPFQYRQPQRRSRQQPAQNRKARRSQKGA